MKYFVLSLFLFLPGTLCSQSGETKIIWDTWGVPHIYARDTEGLFYAQGYAQMNNHANHIIQIYGRSRGKSAEYWGSDHLEDDVLIHTLGLDRLADEWALKQDPEVQQMLRSFVRGLNAYAIANPGKITEENKLVLPLTVKDVNMHAMFVIFTRFVGGSELGMVSRWPDKGSNTYAIGPSRSASGNAMLVQNPHLPWFGEFLFFESNLVLNGRNMYGANLVGFPGLAIGFNESLGWSHTDNTLDNSDTYELEVVNNQYLLDGEPHNFEKRTEIIKVKQADGTLNDQEFELLSTQHGPVIKQAEGKVLALRMVGLDRPNAFLQWWRMINSSNLEEFENALKMAQIPFWNVMYADREGNIFYLFNGLVPRRSSGDWSYWNRIIPGGKSSDIWTEVHSYDDLPKVKNPSNGWLQNANDPPWYSTIPMSLDPSDYPAYMAPQGMYLRPQRSARMLIDDASITFDELVSYKLSTRIELADRLLDDLSEAVSNTDSEKAKAAMGVLQSWDHTADSDSKGTLLFYTWGQKFGIWNQAHFVTPWNASDPVSTPDGIADPERAVRLLEEAADELEAGFGQIDVPWGDYYRIRYHDLDLPANGMDGAMGVFRVLWPGDSDDKHMYAGGGDSWVGIIEFDDIPHAKVLLSYGNATEPDTGHRGDQLELFSRKEMRDAWYLPEDVKAHTDYVETLTEDGFQRTD